MIPLKHQSAGDVRCILILRLTVRPLLDFGNTVERATLVFPYLRAVNIRPLTIFRTYIRLNSNPDHDHISWIAASTCA
jgi:hypothetical protein